MAPVFPQWLLRIPFIRRASPPTAIPDKAEVKTASELDHALLGLFGRAVTPSNVYVTLSITRAETTYVTTIFLAGTGTDVPVPSTPTAPVLTTTVTVATYSTPQPISAAPTSTDPSSTTIIGAIVGAIVGSFVLIFFWWLFCVRGRLFGRGSSSSGSSYRSRSSESM